MTEQIEQTAAPALRPSRTRITSGPKDAPLWVVINAFDKNARSESGAVQPWRSRGLGRVRLALEAAGWAGSTHLRALSSNDRLAHHDSRALALGAGLTPMDRATLRTMAETHAPRILVLVGDAALEAVTGHRSAAKYAGSVEWAPDMGCWVMAIEDPFAWIMDHTKFHAAVRDLTKARRIAEGEEPQVQRAEVRVLRELGEALDALGQINARAQRGYPVACDIEAWAGRVRSIAWSYADRCAVVLPLVTIKGSPLWALAEEDMILAKVREIFSEPEAVWIFQNAIFDDTVMHDLIGVRIAGTVHDTMARHNVLYPDQPKNLGFQVRWYLPWDQYHKDDAKAWKPNSNAKDEDLWQYNGVDADTTRRIYYEQEAEPGRMLGGAYADSYERQLSGLPELYSAVREISLAGLRVDPSVLKAAREDNARAIGEFSAELAGLLGRPVWAVSPEKEQMRGELTLISAMFGLDLAPPYAPKKKAMLAAVVPALGPMCPPILAGMLGAGVSPLDAISALAAGKLPEESFCFAQKGKIKELLYGPREEGGLGLKEQTKRRVRITGATSETVTSDTSALKELLAGLERGPEPGSRESKILICLLSLASLIQMEKAYFTAKPSADGRFRGAYNIAGTTTRRFACNKWFDDTGFNLMTFPRGDFATQIPGLSPDQGKRMGKIAKSLKLSILPDDPGHVIVDMDLAQAEARVVAYESRDPKMIAAFESGADFHSTNAMSMWGYATAADVPKHKRQQMKIGGHGSNYLMGAGALSRDMQSTYGVAKAFQQTYYSTFANIPLWHQALRARIQKSLPIINAFGWPRISHDDPSEDGTLRAMAAHTPQSTIPALVNRGWLQYRKLGQPYGRIMMQTHDSLTASVPIEMVDAYCAMMRALMERSVPVTEIMGPLREGDATSYIIPCDFAVGPNYGDMERYLSAEDEARVESALTSPDGPLSDAEIAQALGVDKDAVGAVRRGRGRDWWQERPAIEEEESDA